MFIHGAADRGAAFARVGRFLPGVDLIRFDRPGYGRSTAPVARGEGDAVLTRQIADVLEVLDWARSTRHPGVPTLVCGHSHGALLALGASLADPGVGGVVAWEPPTPWEPWWPSGSAHDATTGDRDADPAGAAMEAFLRRMIGDDRWDALPESVRAARRAEGPALLGDFAAAQAGGALGLADVAVPVVLGVGGETSARHRRAVLELAGQLQRAEVWEVPGADHGAHVTHAETVAEAVRHCLSLAEGTGTLPP